MGFFDNKSVFGVMKDMVTKGPGGIFKEEARDRMPMATSMNNPDGTINREKMATAQDQGRTALENVGGMKIFGKNLIPPDLAAGYGKMMEDAFKRQEVMMNMTEDYQKQKLEKEALEAEALPKAEPKISL